MELTPEQQQQLEEQKQNCLFCQIINGNKPSLKVYEDDKVVAILDIAPASKGHVLLIPKEHYPIMPFVPEELLKHLFTVAKDISQSLLKSMLVNGTNLFIANGQVAGQIMPHFLIHIIPREENDGVDVFSLHGKNISDEMLNEMQKALTGNLHLRFQDLLAEQGLLEEAQITEQELVKLIKENTQLHQFLKDNINQLDKVIESNPQLEGMFKGKDLNKIKSIIMEGYQETAVGDLLRGKKLDKKDDAKELIKEIETESTEETEIEKKLKEKLSVKKNIANDNINKKLEQDELVKEKVDLEKEKVLLEKQRKNKENADIEEEKRYIETEKKRKQKIKQEESIDLDQIAELLSKGDKK